MNFAGLGTERHRRGHEGTCCGAGRGRRCGRDSCFHDTGPKCIVRPRLRNGVSWLRLLSANLIAIYSANSVKTAWVKPPWRHDLCPRSVPLREAATCSVFLRRCRPSGTGLRLGLHKTDLPHVGADRLAGDFRVCQPPGSRWRQRRALAGRFSFGSLQARSSRCLASYACSLFR